MEQGVYTMIGQEREKWLKGFVGMKELNKFYGRITLQRIWIREQLKPDKQLIAALNVLERSILEKQPDLMD